MPEDDWLSFASEVRAHTDRGFPLARAIRIAYLVRYGKDCGEIIDTRPLEPILLGTRRHAVTAA